MKPTPPSRYRRLPVLVVALVLCGAIMGWVALRLVKQRLIATTGEALALAAAGIADKLDVLLAERHSDMRVLASDARGLRGDPRKLAAHLAQFKAAYPVYQWIVVTDATGRVMASDGPGSPAGDEGNAEWFVAVRDGKDVFVRESSFAKDAGRAEVVLFAMSVRDGEGQLLGAVAAAVGWSAMDELSQNSLRAFRSIPHTGTQIEWQILTREGGILRDSRDDRREPQQLAKAGLPSAVAVARGESGWIEERHARSGAQVITGYAPTQGRGAFRSLGWGVLVRLDRAAAIASVNRVLWRVGLAGGAVVVPLVIALVWSMRRLREEWARVIASEVHLTDTLRSMVETEEQRQATASRLESQNAALAAQARNPTLRSGDLSAAFCAINEVAARTLGVARSGIWLFNDDRSAIRCSDLYEHPGGGHSAGVELRAEQYPRYFAALAENRVIAADDARTDARTCEFRTGYLDPLGITSMLDAPIHSGGEVVGIICHEHIGPPRQWALDEKSFAGSMADLATLSLEVNQRREAELALQRAYDDLERRVAARTAELSQANAALRESEARFRELADAVPQFVWTAKPDGMTDYCNRRWLDYTGLTIEQTQGDGWQVVLHPEDAAQAGERWGRAVATGEPFETEYRLRCATDGSYRWHLARAMAVRDENEQIVRWFGTGTDIEQQKRMEAALRESEASFRLLVATIPGLVWTAAPNGAVEWVSQRAVEYIGRPAEEIIGPGWQEFVHPEDLPNTIALWQRSLATGEQAEIEYRLRGGDGTYRWHLVRALPLREPGGRISKWFGTNVDINDRKRVEQALGEARDAALEADRLKSEFLAMMSHELRTPLNSIIGFTSILREEIVGGLNAEQKKQLGMVHSSARHLLGLINDLLDLSRIESGKMDVFVERFRVADVVTEVTLALAPLVQQKNLLLEAHLDAPDREMCSDRKKVFQILLNLAGNAAKFTEQGSVTIAVQASGDDVVFEISDTGIGITPGQLANLFQAFRQVDGSSRRHYEGTGLGLYLCKKLVTLLGGTIGAESEFGVGSRFRFTIPDPPA
jgi:PAS domain S-box-containing protein